LKSPELTGEWEAKLRQVERGQLDPRQFMAEIVRYTGEVIHSGDVLSIDPGRLGECPRCGRPVIMGKRGYGCSGWRDGCPFVLWREYRGRSLEEDQVRELLQGRVLLKPVTIEGSGEVILQLADSGDLREIPVPTGGPGPKRTAGRGGRRPARQRPARQRTERGGGQTEPTSRRTPRTAPREPKPGRPSKAAPGQRAPAPNFAPIALGPCPLCGSDVIEQEKSYGCSGWRRGCRFAIWKSIAGKAISVRTAQALLRRGQSPLLRGFRSKAGKRFEARLKLEAGAVRFDFGTGDRRRRMPPSPDSL
jgi:DNA topoisomerase-3